MKAVRKKLVKVPTFEPSEKEIETAILDYLQVVPHCHAWKNQTTGMYDPKLGGFRKLNSKHNAKGSCDILACIKGIFVGIEVKKTAKAKATEHQKEFIQNILKAGGVAFVACSISEVIHKLKESRLL